MLVRQCRGELGTRTRQDIFVSSPRLVSYLLLSRHKIRVLSAWRYAFYFTLLSMFFRGHLQSPPEFVAYIGGVLRLVSFELLFVLRGEGLSALERIQRVARRFPSSRGHLICLVLLWNGVPGPKLGRLGLCVTGAFIVSMYNYRVIFHFLLARRPLREFTRACRTAISVRTDPHFPTLSLAEDPKI